MNNLKIVRLETSKCDALARTSDSSNYFEELLVFVFTQKGEKHACYQVKINSSIIIDGKMQKVISYPFSNKLPSYRVNKALLKELEDYCRIKYNKTFDLWANEIGGNSYGKE